MATVGKSWCRWGVLCGLALATGVISAGLGAVQAQEARRGTRPPSERPRSDASEGDPSGYLRRAAERGGDARLADRASLLRAVTRQLEETPTKERVKGAATDYFVLNLFSACNGRGSVEHRLAGGVAEAAGAVVKYLVAAGTEEIRDWEVFTRTKTEKVAQRQLAEAKAKSIPGQLERFPVTPAAGKRSPQDTFVVGTAEVRLADRHADVRFQTMQGTEVVGSFVLAYILESREDTQREWHVFVRYRTEAEAEKFVTNLRQQYDLLESQRAEIAAIYHARTTRRT